MDARLLTPYFLDRPREGLRTLATPEWTVLDPALPNRGTVLERMAAIHRTIAEQVAHALREGRRPFHIAGDCCTAIGVMAGLRRAGVEPLLVWFDAHGDFNTWATTPSGFLGGMPLAMLVGRGEQTLLQAVDLSPFPEDRVVLSDARDLDPGEKEAVAGSQVHHVPRVADLPQVVRECGGHRPLYVHFDVDVLDPAQVPAVNYPAPGGPQRETMAQVFQELAGRHRIAAVSLSAWDPDLPGAQESQALCLELATLLLKAPHG